MTDMSQALNEISKINVALVSFNDSDDLNKYLRNEYNQNKIIAAIQFDDSLAEETKFDNTIDIILRFPSNLRHSESRWMTELVFPETQTMGPRGWDLNEGGPPSYFYEGFLILQQAISLSLIKYLKNNISGKPFDTKSVSIKMQRFPYPKCIQDYISVTFQVFQTFLFYGFYVIFADTINYITMEKEKQLKEIMNISGLPNWLYRLTWFITIFIILLIITIIIIPLLTCKWYPIFDYGFFNRSDPIVIFSFFLCYITAFVAFCFAVSACFSKTTITSFLSPIIWIVLCINAIYQNITYNSTPFSTKLCFCLNINVAMTFGFQLITTFESLFEEGINWTNIWTSPILNDHFTLGHVMIMLLLDAGIYLLFILYVEAVFPGDYRIPLKWYFPCSWSYWSGKSIEYEDIPKTYTENENFEKEPENLKASIIIRHLRKKFSNGIVAVEDLSFNVYEDQITALLGHNGAGKTVTMSMITGIISLTSGTAFIEGYDIRKNLAAARKSIGLCPQHDVSFQELTVEEHLYFYSRLKGFSKKNANAEVNKYLNLLELIDKRNKFTSVLSGGMKRKLSVGMALCGDSKIIICDEPTAGLDPRARRILWDALQSQKKNRTILFTTHYMDEADLLSDRIAIMVKGKLQCCGSSFFLKKKYGIGYRLTLIKSPQCNVNQVTTFLQGYIPNIKVETNVGAELTYTIPNEYVSKFEDMLSKFEKRKAKLNILSFGISLTTLEEVFMRVGDVNGEQNISTQKTDVFTNITEVPTSEDLEGMKVMKKTLPTGCQLWKKQFLAIMIKKTILYIRNRCLLITQILLPILHLVSLILVNQKLANPPKFKMTLNWYNFPVTVFTKTGNSKYAERFKRRILEAGFHLINWKNEDIVKKMLEQRTKRAAIVDRHYIGGASFTDNGIVAWFNNQPYHSASLILQLVIDSVLHEEVSSKYNIQIYNHPFATSSYSQRMSDKLFTNAGVMIQNALGFDMAILSAFYIMSYIRERKSKVKHLQVISGIPILIYWVASFIFDMLTFTVINVLITIVIKYMKVNAFTSLAELGNFFLSLTVFGFAILPMNYLASFLFHKPSTGAVWFGIFNYIFGFMARDMVLNVDLEKDLSKDARDVVHNILLLSPAYSLCTTLENLNSIFITRHFCETIGEQVIDFDANVGNNKTSMCQGNVCDGTFQCNGTEYNYYDWKSPGIGKNIFASVFMGILQIAILLVIELRLFQRSFLRFNSRYNTKSTIEDLDGDYDEDVLKEIRRINSSPIEEINNVLVIKNITKYYGNLLAVNNLCLGVNKFECFGLLGLNGAGKTTTFNVLTGDVRPSSGDVWVNGLNLKHDIQKIYKLIGYCPQFDALLDVLTCMETLTIFGLIRGFSRKECRLMANYLARELDFSMYINHKVKTLSGGNKRKISTAIALIGEPLVVYLDEPTTGIDTATKRHIWNALCKTRDSGKCLMLTSHSMEECEALCTRLTIMVNGKLMCLGSCQHLKNKFSQYFVLIIKLKKNTNLEPVEKFVRSNFSGVTIRERRQELVTFHVADTTTSYSEMFGIMNHVKAYLNIDDYSLCQCSLEQVFLTFAEYQQ